MSNRFHNKFHRENHHSKRTSTNNSIVDASYDPIASYSAPFQGEFYTDGEIVTNSYVQALSAEFTDKLSVTNGGSFGGNLAVGTSLFVGNSAFIGDKLVVGADVNVNGNCFFAKDLTVTGNLSVLKNVTQIDSYVVITSAVEITNTGTGPALKVTQEGNQPIAHFIDSTGDDIIFADNGYVGLGTSTPNEKLTVVGNISATNTVYANMVDLSSVKFTRDITTSTSSVTATDAYIKVIVNGVTKYLRLFDVI